MKASELRIGNWINIMGNPLRIAELRADGGFRYMSARGKVSGVQNIYNIRPVRLTQEWLIKFSFGSAFPKEWDKDDFTLKETDEGFMYFCNQRPVLKYVHQLQNLYFDLTGEELTTQEVSTASTTPQENQ